MATTQVVLGLLVKEAAGRSAILRRYEEGMFDRDLVLPGAAVPRAPGGTALLDRAHDFRALLHALELWDAMTMGARRPSLGIAAWN
jgi:hypothetical protein